MVRFVKNLVFVLLVVFLLPREHNSSNMASATLDLPSTRPAGLHFSAADSFRLAALQIRTAAQAIDTTPSRTQLESLFDKLIYRALTRLQIAPASSALDTLDLARRAAEWQLALHGDSTLLLEWQTLAAMDRFRRARKIETDRLYFTGKAFYVEGDYAKAEQYLAAAMQEARKFAAYRRLLDGMAMLSNCALRLNRFNDALDYAKQGLALAIDREDTLKQVALRFNAGISYSNLAAYQEALSEMQKALKLAQRVEHHRWMAYTLNQLGLLAWRMDLYEKALQHLERALHYGADLDSLFQAGVMCSMAMVHRRLGNYARAGELYRKALASNSKGPRGRDLRAVILNNWGGLLEILGDDSKALSMYEEAFAIERAKKVPARRYLVTYASNIANVCSQSGDYERALKSLQLAMDALRWSPDSLHIELSIVYRQMGNLQFRLGRYAKAESGYRNSLRAANRTESLAFQIEPLIGLGHIALRRGDSLQAIELHKRALDLAHETKVQEHLWRANFELGKTFQTLGHHSQAIAAFARAIQEIERSRERIDQRDLRIQFFGDQQEVYNRMIGMLLASVRPEEALGYAERSRARALIDLFGAQIGDGEAMPRADSEPPLRKGLPEKTTFLEYRLLPDRLLVWLIERDKLVVYDVPITKAELVEKVGAYLRAIGAIDFAAFRQAFLQNPAELYEHSLALGRQLYLLLIAPVASSLQPGQRLILLPDDILYFLPFTALPVDTGEAVQFLVQQYQVGFVPSLLTYRMLAEQRRASVKSSQMPARLFAVGDPRGDLPEAQAEVARIAALFPQSTVVMGVQANEEAVLQGLRSGANYFHFAGHFQINSLDPMRSRLLLAPAAVSGADNESCDTEYFDDGELYASEILSFHFPHIELAVLSGCESALGSIIRGEGMMGMSQVLLGRGISTLISTLWRVDDRATRFLIERFYRYHLDNNMPKLDALCQAQRDAIDTAATVFGIRHPFPYFWAAFVLNGLPE